MRTIHGPKTRAQLRYRRHVRVRRKLSGTAERPRLVVYRSLKHMYAQLVNDELGVTIVGVSDASEGLSRTEQGRSAAPKGLENSWPRRPRQRGSARWSSIGQVIVTMVACRPSPMARAKGDWSSRWQRRR